MSVHLRWTLYIMVESGSRRLIIHHTRISYAIIEPTRPGFNYRIDLELDLIPILIPGIVIRMGINF